jgi:hypothetical protein
MCPNNYTQQVKDRPKGDVVINPRVQSENRDHMRFRAREGIFVVLKPSYSHVGRLIDISMGGLAFDYVVDDVLPKPPAELEIFVKGGAFRLNGIPCEAIWADTTNEGRITVIRKRTCGIRFGRLTDDQKAKLKELIDTFTIGKV